ncbi:hypothetical protein TYRP_018238 [Tyrophagus putrescentiae]|nr:hypothetical protein TYRP_018238 [Tyrophagus putrescentiae]
MGRCPVPHFLLTFFSLRDLLLLFLLPSFFPSFLPSFLLFVTVPYWQSRLRLPFGRLIRDRQHGTVTERAQEVEEEEEEEEMGLTNHQLKLEMKEEEEGGGGYAQHTQNPKKRLSALPTDVNGALMGGGVMGRMAAPAAMPSPSPSWTSLRCDHALVVVVVDLAVAVVNVVAM